jgi:hypothetical protein
MPAPLSKKVALILAVGDALVAFLAGLALAGLSEQP